MFKTIIKEFGIVILLLVAVALVLAIIFYDYIPNNKTVPIKIQAYNVPEDIKQELEESIEDEQNIVRTYYIDSTDLDLYESTNDYNKGKENPFADYTQEEPTSNINSITNNINKNNTNTAENHIQKDDNEVYIDTPGKNY